MTIRVINDTPDPSVVKTAICRNCGVKLEFVPVDVQKYVGTDYSGGPSGQTWIDCPNCKKEIILSSW